VAAQVIAAEKAIMYLSRGTDTLPSTVCMLSRRRTRLTGTSIALDREGSHLPVLDELL